MLYGQEPQLLMISRNNDDETDNISDSMDSITPQELRPPIIAGLTLDHNNSWYYNEGQNANQRTYDEPHPHAPSCNTRCKHVHHATLAPPMVEDTIPVVPRVSELLQKQRMVSSTIQHLFHRLSQPTMDLIL
jgi:hypothetical protein